MLFMVASTTRDFLKAYNSLLYLSISLYGLAGRGGLIEFLRAKTEGHPKKQLSQTGENLSIPTFHRIGPLGRFGLVVEMSVYIVSPSHAILQGEQRRSQGSKAVSHRGTSTLNKCT